MSKPAHHLVPLIRNGMTSDEKDFEHRLGKKALDLDRSLLRKRTRNNDGSISYAPLLQSWLGVLEADSSMIRYVPAARLDDILDRMLAIMETRRARRSRR